jgi:hypothetical protein
LIFACFFFIFTSTHQINCEIFYERLQTFAASCCGNSHHCTRMTSFISWRNNNGWSYDVIVQILWFSSSKYQNWSVIVLRVYSVKNALWKFFSLTHWEIIVISAEIVIKEQSLELTLWFDIYHLLVYENMIVYQTRMQKYYDVVPTSCATSIRMRGHRCQDSTANYLKFSKYSF